MKNKEADLRKQNKEKEKRADELDIANEELKFQEEEKEKRADELVIANKELKFQNKEKEKRADELVIANKELKFQNKEKEKRANELDIANEELKHLSNHDYLTDLYNRRYYLEQFKNFDNERLYPIGVMMMDVNGLKIINDAFGHGIGDSALKMIGNALKDTFKEKDIVSRIGGDEFAVLLPNTTRNKLQEYNEQIVSKVKTLKVKNVELSLAVGYEFKKSISEEIDDILELAENRMYSHKTTEGTSVRGRAINAILETLTDKYDIEREHSQRVSQISVLIAKALTLMRAADIKGLEQAGLFHDIGKISIPDKILNKPGKLTNEEYDIIKTHTEVGYQILRAADEYSGLAIHALHHHEHWDGSGYPKGLKGKDIPLFSRIICVADAYDAMTSDRPYRKKMSEEFAISEIKKCSGTQFDPKIANIFLEKVVIKLNEK